MCSAILGIDNNAPYNNAADDDVTQKWIQFAHIIFNDDSVLEEIYKTIKSDELCFLHTIYGKIDDGIDPDEIDPDKMLYKEFNIFKQVGKQNHSSEQFDPELYYKTNKYYNLERITEVIVLEETQEFNELHHLDETDIFGFSKLNGERFQVELSLTLRAYILLKEEYPKIDKHIKKDKSLDAYNLKIEVNNPKPITRFILGLKDDIEVTGSKSFLKHISEFD